MLRWMTTLFCYLFGKDARPCFRPRALLRTRVAVEVRGLGEVCEVLYWWVREGDVMAAALWMICERGEGTSGAQFTRAAMFIVCFTGVI